MDDSLIDDDALSLSRKSRLPGKGFFYPDSLDEEYAEERVREACEGAEAVIVADSDADGLGSVALIRKVRDAALDVAPFETELTARLRDEDEPEGEADVTVNGAGENEADDEDEESEESPVALVAAGPHSLGEALERVAEYLEPDADVYVCDLCPDSVETVSASLESLASRAGAVRWFDHHQWDEEVAAFVRETGVDLVVGDSDEECTTDVTLRSLAYDFPERFTELAEVTRDHDLWLNEDPRSKDLADYAYWSSSEEYVAVVGAYGADLPDSVIEYVEYRRVEKEALIDRAVDRAEFTQVGEWTVGVTYGRCSQNEVADALREQGADASVVVKPAGSASLRGSDGFERCHEVAALVNGGGHPKAAGCKPDIYDDMLDYAHHWTTEGATTKRVILAAFERVAAEVEPGDESDEGIDTER
ncbi:phosphohydrolase [Salinigranum rubrum]|uniref:Phosphohydrolase n=1 Tax=Salinigranum rubrum TaxID=755307 RepID=A0A2I8VGY5_9EURY|nr:phosphohydrolase [Salinigranum rubrum]AUV80319.1 phosphohydrolase [Salinigranum rubrum]